MIRIILVHTPFNWRRPLTIISHLIRLVTGNFWNHAAILVRLGNSWFIVESDIKGVVLLPFKEWIKEQTIQVWKPLESSYRFDRMMGKVGHTKYDFLSLFWFQLVYQLTGKFYGFTSERKAAQTFYCYEFIAWVYEFDEWFKVDPEDFIEQMEDRQMTMIQDRIKASDYEKII